MALNEYKDCSGMPKEYYYFVIGYGEECFRVGIKYKIVEQLLNYLQNPLFSVFHHKKMNCLH